MQNLIEALTIMAKYYPDLAYPTNCSHDELRVMCDPARFSKEEIETLESLGFMADIENESFYSYTFGSC